MVVTPLESELHKLLERAKINIRMYEREIVEAEDIITRNSERIAYQRKLIEELEASRNG